MCGYYAAFELTSLNLQLSASVAAETVKQFLLAAITMVTGFSVLNTKTHGGFNELLTQLTMSGTMAAKCVNFFLPNAEMANLVYDLGMEKIYLSYFSKQ